MDSARTDTCSHPRASRASRSSRRGYSLMEITLTFAVIAIASTLIMPRLLAGEQGGTARQAQTSVELAVATGLELYEISGGLSADLVELESRAPRLTFTDRLAPSTSTSHVSVSITDDAFVAATSDTKGYCWGVIRAVSGSGRAELHVAVATETCTAAAIESRITAEIPTGQGGSWSSPFED